MSRCLVRHVSWINRHILADFPYLLGWNIKQRVTHSYQLRSPHLKCSLLTLFYQLTPEYTFSCKRIDDISQTQTLIFVSTYFKWNLNKKTKIFYIIMRLVLRQMTVWKHYLLFDYYSRAWWKLKWEQNKFTQKLIFIFFFKLFVNRNV